MYENIVQKDMNIEQVLYDKSDYFCLVKWNMGEIFSISGPKMIVKSGLEEIFLKFLYVISTDYGHPMEAEIKEI